MEIRPRRRAPCGHKVRGDTGLFDRAALSSPTGAAGAAPSRALTRSEIGT